MFISLHPFVLITRTIIFLNLRFCSALSTEISIIWQGTMYNHTAEDKSNKRMVLSPQKAHHILILWHRMERFLGGP